MPLNIRSEAVNQLAEKLAAGAMISARPTSRLQRLRNRPSHPLRHRQSI
jgi:hypothetical protein